MLTYNEISDYVEREMKEKSGAVVVANPTLEGDEALLNSVEISKVKYKINNPDIKINPILAGTEPLMTGIDVNGVKYKAPESSQLYVHKVRIGVEYNRFNIKIISTDAEPYTENNYIAKINLAQLDEGVEGCSSVWSYNTSLGVYEQITIYATSLSLKKINNSGQAETVSPSFRGDDVSVLSSVRLD